MGVRTIFPDSISFVVTIQTCDQDYRVEVLLDLQERLLFVSSGILVDISDRLLEFTQQLSQISANVLAAQRWDGMDAMTEYQDLEILMGYTIQRSYLRFNVVFNQAWLLPVTELEGRSNIQIE